MTASTSADWSARSRNVFVVARNPNEASKLPYVVSLPVAGERPLVLACRAPWPATEDVFCYELEVWPDGAETIDEVPVRSCRRLGGAVHLVLERRQRKRALFVWTERNGRAIVFWRTRETMRRARPGVRVPAARGLEGPLEIAVDHRERYPWRFAGQQVRCVPRELPVGDYGVFLDDQLVGVVERKSAADLVGAAVGGSLSLVLAELAVLPHAVLVLECRLSDVLKAERVRRSWVLSLVAGLQVSHPRVPWLFAETRPLAEDLAFRWLAAARKAAMIDAAGDASPRRVADDPARYATQLPLPVRDRAGRLTEASRLALEGRVWTTADFAAHFAVGKRTAWSDLRQLVATGVLEAAGGRRNRRYVAVPRGLRA